MNRCFLGILATAMMMILLPGCATDGTSGGGNRQPAGYSRAGREWKEPRPMNHRRMDTDAIYNACLRERTEMYCRNRMGR